MPIRDVALSQNYIKLEAASTPLDALEALKAKDGALWWHLVVEYNGGWRAIQFIKLKDLVIKMGPDFFLTPLYKLPIPQSQSIDQDVINTTEAKNKARRNSNKLLVVTSKNRLKGILYVGGTRGDQFAAPLLVELYGSVSLTADDIRAYYKEKAPPSICRYCNQASYVDYDVVNDAFRCRHCKEIRE